METKMNRPNQQEDYQIAIIPGDGTGPEVVRESLKVLDILDLVREAL